MLEVWLKGEFDCIYEGEYIQRHLEDSRAGREGSKLDITNIAELGHEWREGEQEKEKWGQADQESQD